MATKRCAKADQVETFQLLLHFDDVVGDVQDRSDVEIANGIPVPSLRNFEDVLPQAGAADVDALFSLQLIAVEDFRSGAG